jgi:hypothetical protein
VDPVRSAARTAALQGRGLRPPKRTEDEAMGDDGQRRTPVVPANIDEFNKAAGLSSRSSTLRCRGALTSTDRPSRRRSESMRATPCPPAAPSALCSAKPWNGWSWRGYTASFGSSPGHGVISDGKRAQALNAVPPGLNETVGTELKKAVERGSWPDLSSKVTWSAA